MTEELAMGSSAAARSCAGARSPWSVAACLRGLASLKLTLAVLIALGAGVMLHDPQVGSSVWLITAPLLVGACNLGAAVLVNPVFRRQSALLTFHLALLVIVVLAAAGRLTYLKGELELAQGEVFEGRLTRSEHGPWHRSQLERVRFVNDGYTIGYEEGVRRAETRNVVRWLDDTGREQRSVIGDIEPLVRHGYRFYTSFNKGFAPVFIWHPANGVPQRGAINLPSYPIHEFGQALEWTLPGTEATLWTMLQFDEVLLDPARKSQFRLPARHTLVVRANGERHELQPGTRLAFPQGVLEYERLSTWMGYTVHSDWTLPWLAAASLLAVVSLGWHFWRLFALQPWDT